MPSPPQKSLACLALLAALVLPSSLPAQSLTEQDAFHQEQLRTQAATAADYNNMLQQLGLTRESLRPGANGSGTGPHAVIYDESQVTPFTLPDPLLLSSGRPVRTPALWWSKRRPELAHLLEDSMYGRIPAHTPTVTWTVLSRKNIEEGEIDAVTEKLQGHLDNTADPSINVDISVELTLPAHPGRKVPVIIALDWPPDFWAAMARRTGHPMPTPKGPSARAIVLSHGYGYALLDPTSVQADNGAGLTAGVIGLTNHGARRTPDQWGALRAWGWGASRLLDFLDTQPTVDSHRVAIFGHSRYGKAALVAMAFDARFAAGFISSSGEAGAKLSHRIWGERLENVAAESEYHWMAGNFLRYASTRNVSDLPVDAHDLIALCAPRAVFLSAGTQAAGDGWADARGMFLAAVAAGPVYKLLGSQDLGTTVFPPVLTEVGAGPLAFRQHAEGHTPAPNWPFFLGFMQRELYGPDFLKDLIAQ